MRTTLSSNGRRIAAACLAMIAFALPCFAATSGPVQSLDDVRTAATLALRQHYESPGSRVVVDSRPFGSRLKLAPCPLPLKATVKEGAAPASLMTVRVQCPQPGGWIVRVPLRLQLFRPVLITTRPLQRGDGIHASDLRTEERDVTRLGYGYIENPDQLTGRTLARPLVAGSVLTPAAMGGRHMVRAGDHVQLIARQEGIEVRAGAIALGGGDNGARLRVRNESSGRVIDAMVSAPGVVLALP
ncbi:MAG: flagellar basal body P-ring formation protein FlgA [Pseudomonadota bacterium]|nr:flagellar basal body P-ring formation protein FlgA [Pseudomonadota bacterium]